MSAENKFRWLKFNRKVVPFENHTFGQHNQFPSIIEIFSFLTTHFQMIQRFKEHFKLTFSHNKGIQTFLRPDSDSPIIKCGEKCLYRNFLTLQTKILRSILWLTQNESKNKVKRRNDYNVTRIKIGNKHRCLCK